MHLHTTVSALKQKLPLEVFLNVTPLKLLLQLQISECSFTLNGDNGSFRDHRTRSYNAEKNKKKARQKTEREPAFVDAVSDAAVIGQEEASLVRC